MHDSVRHRSLMRECMMVYLFFFFNDTATTEIYTLSLHDALPISELDEPDLPVFLVSGCKSPFGAEQPVSFYTTDLGKGMISGLCSDLNRIKGPILRGLA